jgi:hypothetical protein
VLDNPSPFALLLGTLREARAEQQAKPLSDRLAAEGLFDLFREQAGHEMRYKLGRELNGSPASPWNWNDLDLSRGA